MKKIYFMCIGACLTLAVFFLLCMTLIQCTEQRESVVRKFKIEQELKATVVNVPPVILSPQSIFITDKHFVVVSPRKDTIFDVFTFPGLKYSFSDGIKGQGPDDFSPMMDRKAPIAIGDGFKVFFVDKSILRESKIDEAAKSITTVKKETFNFNDSEGLISGFSLLGNDKVLYFGGATSDKEYNIFNIKTGETQPVSDYPNWTELGSGDIKMMVYLKSAAVKPDGKKFASVYGNFKRLRIYNDEGTLLNEISVEIPPFTYSSDPKEKYSYYTYPLGTDNYVYAICRNRKSGEPQKDFTELHVFDWTGNPVAKLILDKVLNCFTVSEKDKLLYGVNNEEGNEDKIFTYSLPF